MLGLVMVLVHERRWDHVRLMEDAETSGVAFSFVSSIPLSLGIPFLACALITSQTLDGGGDSSDGIQFCMIILIIGLKDVQEIPFQFNY
jgi:hypothetical protein